VYAELASMRARVEEIGGSHPSAMVPCGVWSVECQAKVPRSLEPCDGMLCPVVGHQNPKRSPQPQKVTLTL